MEQNCWLHILISCWKPLVNIVGLFGDSRKVFLIIVSLHCFLDKKSLLRVYYILSGQFNWYLLMKTAQSKNILSLKLFQPNTFFTFDTLLWPMFAWLKYRDTVCLFLRNFETLENDTFISFPKSFKKIQQKDSKIWKKLWKKVNSKCVLCLLWVVV